MLIDGISDYVEKPVRQLDAEVPVTAKAMELGALRHKQGFNAHEILKEHEILGGIIFVFLTGVIDEINVPWSGRELALCFQQVSQAVELIRQATMTHCLRLSAQLVNERKARLRRFNRMVAHELKTRVGAIRGAELLLPEPWLEPAQREHRCIGVMTATAAHVLARRVLFIATKPGGGVRQNRRMTNDSCSPSRASGSFFVFGSSVEFLVSRPRSGFGRQSRVSQATTDEPRARAISIDQGCDERSRQRREYRHSQIGSRTVSNVARSTSSSVERIAV